MLRGRRAAHSDRMPSSPPFARVFLADDYPPLRERVSTMLAAGGMEVIGQAATPRDCIAAILATQPDVVVLDVQLEGGTGLEVLKAVRAAQPRIAFVVFTNNVAPAYCKRYLAAGAACFLDKNADFNQLGDAVAAARQRQIH